MFIAFFVILHVSIESSLVSGNLVLMSVGNKDYCREFCTVYEEGMESVEKLPMG